MFALVFESPERLWWSFALLIPLMVHLLRRRRYQQHSWAAMQFVLQALQQESQKAKLHNLLLMLLRVSILAVFLFAISAPRTGFIRPKVGDESSGTHHIMIVDATYSMGTIDQTTDETALTKAKQKAIEYVRSLPAGDVVSVFTIGDFQHSVIEDPGNNLQLVANAIHEIEPQSSGGDADKVFQLSIELAKRHRQRDPNLFFTRFVIFSDMERDVWRGLSDSAGNLSPSLMELKEIGELSVVDCRVAPAGNSAITQLSVKYPQGAFASAVSVVAEIDCYYKEIEGDLGVSWFLDNEFVVRDEVQVGAGETIAVEAPFRNLSSGSHQIEARLDDDSLLLDNARWVAFDSPAQFRVLCVDGSEKASAAVALAFSPHRLPDWPVFVDTIDQIEFEQQHLDDFDVIAFCGSNRISEFNARRLRGFVKQGGTLLITPGELVDPFSLNKFYGDAFEGFLNEVQWGNPVDNDSVAELQKAVRVTDHSIGGLFRKNPDNGIRALPVYKYVELIVDSENTADVVLELNNGSPLLVCSSVGKGHVLTLSTSAEIGTSEDRWSDLGVWPSFLPLIHESMRFIVEQEISTSNLELGVFPTRRISMQNGPVSVSVQNPNGQTNVYAMNFSRDADSKEVFANWSHTEFKFPGVYYVNLYSAEQIVDSSLVVGNLAVTESSHQIIDEVELARITGVKRDKTGVINSISPGFSRELFRELLLFTLVLLMLETLWVTSQRTKASRRKVIHE